MTWVREAVESEQSFRNFTAFEIISICCDLSENPPYFIHGNLYDFVLMGWVQVPGANTKKRTGWIIQIHGYRGPKLFEGPHQITIVEALDENYLPLNSMGKPKWFNSLTCFRHKFFDICDKLSFIRSTFLIHYPTHQLLRIENFRYHLVFPIFPIASPVNLSSPLRRQNSMSLSSPGIRSRPHSLEKKRKLKQLTSNTQKLFTLYLSEYTDVQKAREEMIQDISNILNTYTMTITTPSQEIEVYPWANEEIPPLDF